MQTPPSSTFVAEIGVAAALHAGMASSVRQQLDPADAWGVVRGYWDIWYSPDSAGTDRPIGILLTVQYVAEGREVAEDKALRIGTRVGQMAAFFVGAPSSPPELQRLAQVNVDDHLIAQWNYFYDNEHPPSILLQPQALREFLRRLAATETATRQKLELAARWYGLSTGDLSLVDKYLGVWIGLEAIGPLLDDHYHAGPRAPCAQCGFAAGERRDRGAAGIQHLVLRVAPELLEERTFQDLRDYRNDIAHGLKPHDEIERDIDPLVPDLQLCLGVGMLAARDGPADEPAFGWQGALPRDYAKRPDARSAIRPPSPLPDHVPFAGDWIELTRTRTSTDVGVNDIGEYRNFGDVRTDYKATVPTGTNETDFKKEYVLFRRFGVTYELTNKNVSPPTPIRPEEWRDRPVSPAWQRVADASRKKAD